jgi:methionyl-tRNA synthetase
MPKPKFYVTTAIPYVNAKPHIGFALELLQTDALARWHRQQGYETFFLTGTDENALKNVQAAESAHQSTDEYVSEMSGVFRELSLRLGISNDGFIRTTEPRHFASAQKLWNACKPQDIYLRSYQGLYCVGCEQFYTSDELVDGKCPEHKTAPEPVSEENYFFKLSNYQSDLEQLIESNQLKITPASRKNEMLAFIRQGLEDFSISRSHRRARGWGVPVPGDDKQVMYVWFDALSNYLTALGYADEGELYKKFWTDNQNRVHVIGKGISRFHCIYWPAMLMSAGLPLPSEVFIHGYVTVEGEKISKSLGNTVDPVELIDRFGLDPVRYYLLSEIPAYADGDYSEARFRERYQSDLAHGIGNALSRVTNMIEKFGEGKFNHGESISQYSQEAGRAVDSAMERFEFNIALSSINDIIRSIDSEIDKHKPWEMAKSGEVDSIQHLLDKWGTQLLDFAQLARPFIPGTADKIEEALKVQPVTKTKPLFPRLDK